MAIVRYIVKDVSAAVEFYTKLLGFTVVEQYGPAMAILSKDDLTLWVAGPQASASRPMPDGRVPEPGSWSRFVVETDDIQALANKLKEAGAHFRNEVITGPGGSQTLVEDPSGNVVELFQPAQR
jgi:predicted enzyme related to lactoylglutathione lyase